MPGINPGMTVEGCARNLGHHTFRNPGLEPGSKPQTPHGPPLSRGFRFLLMTKGAQPYFPTPSTGQGSAVAHSVEVAS